METAETMFNAAKNANISELSPGAITDFGIDGYKSKTKSEPILRFMALCAAVRKGATLEDFIEASCDGDKIGEMIDKFCGKDSAAARVDFHVIYDDM
jgi:hypothetical protein